MNKLRDREVLKGRHQLQKIETGMLLGLFEAIHRDDVTSGEGNPGRHGEGDEGGYIGSIASALTIQEDLAAELGGAPRFDVGEVHREGSHTIIFIEGADDDVVGSCNFIWAVTEDEAGAAAFSASTPDKAEGLAP